MRRFDNPVANARQDVADLRHLRLQTVSTADLLPLALDLVLAYDLTVYDGCYAALSQKIERPLITADAPLRRKLEGSAITIMAL